MYMLEWISVQVQERKNGTKSVEVVIDNESDFQFDLSVFPHTRDDDFCLQHLERLLRTDPSDGEICYPPPDISDMRELLENQSVDVDTMVVSPDDVSGDLLRLLPEIRRQHSIENRAAFILLEGDIGLLEPDGAAQALRENCNTEVLPVGFFKGDIPGKVYASLWWFDRRAAELDG